MRRRRRRPLFTGMQAPRLTKKQKLIIKLLIVIAVIAAVMLPVGRYMNGLMSEFGVSTVRDQLMIEINDLINAKMTEGEYEYDYFINLEKDSVGNITALTTNMSRINQLSSEIVRDVVSAAEAGQFDLSIPMGSLMGINIAAGRGPGIPVRVLTLTSSTANFQNEFSSAGINQTKHEIWLEVSVDVDVLIPWDSARTTIVTEILVAETVIVGKVPDTYLNWG